MIAREAVQPRWYSPFRETHNDYPLIRVHESDEYAEVDLGEAIMEFRLTYQGPLFADRGRDDLREARRKHIHAIRHHFHKQLKELWNVESRLKWMLGVRPDVSSPLTWMQQFAKDNERHGINWAPLITEKMGAVCGLDILFLRHEPKEGLIQSGDLDNRIKTLFDALTIPPQNQLPDQLDTTSEPDPFFCLLSDDKWIIEFKVTADRLLTPVEKQSDNDVHLLIAVRTFVSDHDRATVTIGGAIHR